MSILEKCKKNMQLPPEINKDRVAKWLLIINIFIFVVAIYLTDGKINLQIRDIKISPFDLASLLVTTSGILLTFVTIFIGVVAVFGYNVIMKNASKSATNEALAEFEKEKNNLVDSVLKALDDRRKLQPQEVITNNEEAKMITSLMSGEGNE